MGFTPLGYLIVIVSTIWLVLMIPLSVYFYKGICCNGTNEKYSNKKINVTSVIVFSCFLLGAGGIYASNIFVLLNGYNSTITTPSGAFYGIGLILIQLIFILRIQYTFTGTLSIFMYSATTIKLLYGLYFSNITLFLMAVISNILKIFFILTITAPLWIICYITNYILLITLLFKKIIVMMRYKVNINGNQNENNTNDKTETTNGESVSVTTNGLPANGIMVEITSINLLVRFSLLSLISFITTMIVLLAALIDSIFINHLTRSDIAISNVVTLFDAMSNAICICLLFIFASDLYYKLCKFCDKCVKHCMISKVFQNTNENEAKQKEFKKLLFRE
eukprot:331492_1